LKLSGLGKHITSLSDSIGNGVDWGVKPLTDLDLGAGGAGVGGVNTTPVTGGGIPSPSDSKTAAPDPVPISSLFNAFPKPATSPAPQVLPKAARPSVPGPFRLPSGADVESVLSPPPPPPAPVDARLFDRLRADAAMFAEQPVDPRIGIPFIQY
jgi:hypothetical protein